MSDFRVRALLQFVGALMAAATMHNVQYGNWWLACMDVIVGVHMFSLAQSITKECAGKHP